MARLAVLVPRPRLNLTRFYSAGENDVTALAQRKKCPEPADQRVSIAIEACPDCGGKLRVIACIEEPALIAKILGHVRARDAAAGVGIRAPPAQALL